MCNEMCNEFVAHAMKFPVNQSDFQIFPVHVQQIHFTCNKFYGKKGKFVTSDKNLGSLSRYEFAACAINSNICFKCVPQVSRLVGDIRRGPAWGPLELLVLFPKIHFMRNRFVARAMNLLHVQ